MHARIWTIVFQAINFLVLVWLLRRFLFRPVLDAVDKRRTETERVVNEANAAKQAAEKLQQELKAQREGIEAERTRVVESAQAKAEDEREALLDAARTESLRFQKAALEEVARERSEADALLLDHASAVAVELARRILISSMPDSVPPAMEQRLISELNGMTAEQRRRLVGDRAVEVVTPLPLAAPEQERLRARLEEVCGQSLSLKFSVDAAVLAGLEVHFAGGVLRDSWRDSLAVATHELAAA